MRGHEVVQPNCVRCRWHLAMGVIARVCKHDGARCSTQSAGDGIDFWRQVVALASVVVPVVNKYHLGVHLHGEQGKYEFIYVCVCGGDACGGGGDAGVHVYLNMWMEGGQLLPD